MEATGRQPTTLKGLSRFLVEHEPCGAGFDVSHPAGLGSGRVSMTCRGCGATYEYATATIEFEREVEFEPIAVEPRPNDAATASAAANVAQTPPPEIEAAPEQAREAPEKTLEAPEPEPPIEVGPPAPTPNKKKRDKRVSKGWTRDRVITAGLLFFSAAALVFAVVRVIGDNSESAEPVTPTPSTAITTPDKPAPAKPKAPAAAKPEPAQKPSQKPAPAPANKPTADEKVVKTDRFSVTVPKDWVESAAAGGGTLLAPPGDAAVSLQIFYEDDPGLSAHQMSVQTEHFLRSRDRDATISNTKKLKVDGHAAFELSATGPAGSQTALGVIDDPYRYLAIVSADPGTPGSLKAEATRAMLSFRPR